MTTKDLPQSKKPTPFMGGRLTNMSNRDFLFNYNEENDILFIYHSAKKSKGSIEYGQNIHISFSPKKEIVGIELLGASGVLTALAKSVISKRDLKNIVRCSLKAETQKGLLFIKFFISIKEKEPIEEQLVLQDIGYRSPVAEYA